MMKKMDAFEFSYQRRRLIAKDINNIDDKKDVHQHQVNMDMHNFIEVKS